MEALLDNLARFAEVLAVARSPWAAHWDEAQVRRAFQWARYLEQLNRRLEGAEAGARQAFRMQLLSPGPDSGSHPLPRYRRLRFEELDRGEELLSEALLCNPAASAAAFHRAAAWHRAPRRRGDEGAAVPASLRRAVRLKAAAGLLLLLRGAGGDDDESETGAQMVRERLEERLRGPEELPERRAACEAVLRRAVSGGGGGEPLSWRPLAELLAAASTTGGGEAQALALRWLLGDRRALAAFCRALPRSLLSCLAALQPAFRQDYLDFLVDWGYSLSYHPGRAEWAPQDGSPEQGWDQLLEHFAALLEGPPQAKEPTERRLHSLKTTDGDFEVGGISIWTDLLLALKM
ncbi:Fanconi anemia group F protein [Mustelus asterias]